MIRKLILAAIVSILVTGVAGQLLPQAMAQAQCSALKAEYQSSYRPKFLRVVKRDRDVAAYFRNELRRASSGDSPTRAEIRKAYTKTRGACRNNSCQSAAKDVYAATLQLYTFNRRWKKAGCPGVLSS
jgi:hypothetical protein